MKPQKLATTKGNPSVNAVYYFGFDFTKLIKCFQYNRIHR